MTITIPDDVLTASHLTEEEIMTEIALLLFSRDRITLAQASSLSGMTLIRFQHLLASRGITVHYDAAEFEHDLTVLRELDP